FRKSARIVRNHSHAHGDSADNVAAISIQLIEPQLATGTARRSEDPRLCLLQERRAEQLTRAERTAERARCISHPNDVAVKESGHTRVTVFVGAEDVLAHEQIETNAHI